MRVLQFFLVVCVYAVQTALFASEASDLMSLTTCAIKPEKVDEPSGLSLLYRCLLEDASDSDMDHETPPQASSSSDSDTAYVSAKKRNRACVRCGAAFPDRAHLLSHMLTHAKADIFRCPTCDQKFKTTLARNEHFKAENGHSIKLFDDFYAVKQEDLKTAYEHLALPPEKNTRGAKFLKNGRIHYECCYSPVVCARMFLSKNHLYTHLLGHIGRRLFDCKVCDQAFITPHVRNQHMRKMHQISISSYQKGHADSKILAALIESHMYRVIQN